MNARCCDICGMFYKLSEESLYDYKESDSEVYFSVTDTLNHLCPDCTLKLEEFMFALRKGVPIMYGNAQYLCDRKACTECIDECKYTGKINHAINFELIDDTYFEKEKNNA